MTAKGKRCAMKSNYPAGPVEKTELLGILFSIAFN
jgi:hypothetical protein